MKALAPLKKTIVVETSVARMNDSEFIQNLAHRRREMGYGGR